MTAGYAKGGYIHGDRTTGVGYDPDVDGPLIDPDAHDRWFRREIDRLNRSAPAED